MVRYHVTVSTADVVAATTFNNVFIKLVGEDGESERRLLVSLKGAVAFIKGAVSLRFHSSSTCFEYGAMQAGARLERKTPALALKGLPLFSLLGV